LNGLKEDVATVRRQAEIFGRASSTGARYGRERDELIHRRKATNRNSGGDLNALVDEGASLGRSIADVADILETGSASLGELKAQRARMTGVQKMLMDMGDTLGISSSVMRIVQRRDVTDRYIVYGGIILTLIIMYFCFR